jgi:hypothetical protein
MTRLTGSGLRRAGLYEEIIWERERDTAGTWEKEREGRLPAGGRWSG